MLDKIYPGKVFISINYDPFKHEMVKHPFVVWYSQIIDDSTLNNNVYAFRISSQKKNSNDLVEITDSISAGLDKKSYICVDSLWIFNIKDITKTVGTIDSNTWFLVMKKKMEVNQREYEQNIKEYTYLKNNENK